MAAMLIGKIIKDRFRVLVNSSDEILHGNSGVITLGDVSIPVKQ